MSNSNSSKQVLLSVIGIAILVIAVVGVAFAFFNYTRTGTSNTIKVGRISFVSRQTDTINLTNLFPIDPTNTSDMNDSTKVGTVEIEIEGDTDYNDGVEYLISAVDSSITTNGKTLPISLDITVTTLGTESSSYWTARESKNATIYKKLVGETLEGNGMLLVGYIKPNTTSGTAEGVDGSITIKAYLDKNKILISDTYNNGENPTDNLGTPASTGEGKTVFTTTEWNALQANGVSFKVKVEANEGIWVEEPIAAYTQVIRNVITPENPINFANVSSSSNGEGLYILPGTENDTNPIYYYRGAVNNNNVIFGDYCWQMVRTTDTGGIKMIYNGAVTGTSEEPTCENTAHADRIISSSTFNSQYESVADVGYMKNARYTYTNAAGAEGSIYGKKVEWDGNNYLVIEDTANTASTNTTKDNNHHYSCGTQGTTSCPSVRYYYYNNYYITLTGGDFVEDAIYKMTGSIVNQDIDVVTRNQGYVLNNVDSTVKTAIESWFRTNLTNEVDNTKRNYVNYLEDTVYCNDRSVKTTAENTSYPTYQESGWNPSGGELTKYLYFGTWNRFRNNWYSTVNVPSTTCPNEIDRFSVGSSVAHLNYPVGLLTADEIIMAGASGNSITSNNTYYLYTGIDYWSLSPDYFYHSNAVEFLLDGNGRLNGGYVSYSAGVRPVVSLKHSVEFETGGNGTPTNPYVVKYE